MEGGNQSQGELRVTGSPKLSVEFSFVDLLLLLIIIYTVYCFKSANCLCCYISDVLSPYDLKKPFPNALFMHLQKSISVTLLKLTPSS